MLKKLQPETINALITRGLAIETDEALDAGMLGFVARCMMLASLPHSRVAGNEFSRHNGAFSLSIMSPRDVGLPYGTVPRLLLAWLTTEAVRHQSRDLVLGDSLSGFMRQLDMVPTGGRWGSIGRLKNQTERLFSSNVTAIYRDEKRTAIRNHSVVDKADLWWEPKDPAQASLWESTVTLGEQFFIEIIDRPVPIDLRALRALKKSPLALDIYTWLTYRMSYLQRSTVVSWGALQGQFGCGYPTTPQGQRDFRKHFLPALRKVLTIYGGAKAVPTDAGMRLEPGRPHVRKLT
jgi:replication initiator protein